jgi:signal peptidase I
MPHRLFPRPGRRRLPRRLVAGLASAGLASAAIATAVVAATSVLRGRYLRVAVAGESMTPGLQPDDFIVLRSGPPAPEKAYGQIVALRDPRPGRDGRVFLKRIVGLPGESLRVGGGVQVNGRSLEEPYAHGDTPHEQHRGINRLEPGEYFVMGDHRSASTDSRDFGPIRADAILGTAVLRYWPPERIGRLRPPPRRLVDATSAPHAEGVATPLPLPWVGGPTPPAPNEETTEHR